MNQFTNCHEYGFIECLDDWMWSSSKDYCGLETEKIDLMIIEY